MTDYAAILDAPMGPNDADAKDVRAYLKALLTELWTREESFSGKRPFGNSGWQHDVYGALVAAKLCPGTLDDDGYVKDVDHDTVSKLILGAIASL